ncbi:MAG: 30S ribosome-binding factor RbfA [Dehalococcoidia bacterium]|nr:30S ribosome-binding factor RbfA [Dehalococcoidia bacterium]MSQ16808.1 30S ribosome-binding factor RbfA [Dehalococcoidia bacterium]
MSRRIDRINGLLQQEISQLLAQQINDPRLKGVISITQVSTSSDMRNARVSLSVMGDKKTQDDGLAGIRSAAAFLRRELKERLTLRYVPFLSFQIDNSLENADRVVQVMNRIQELSPELSPLSSAPAAPAPMDAQVVPNRNHVPRGN